LDPTFEEAHHLLGLAYLDRHWRRKALDAFRQAQRLNPKKMRYRDLVGYLSGRSEVPLPRVEGEAAEWLARAEKSLQSDQSAEALRCYGRALRLEPENPTVLMSHALACLQMNRHQESEAITRKVLDLNPGEMLKATAYAALIEALRGEGRYSEGNRVGDRLLGEGTSNFAQTIAYYELAYNLAEMEEDLDRALDYAHRSLELAPDELKEFPLAALGWVHYKRREFDKAVEFLSRSTELEKSSTTLTHLGMALLASGNEEQAKSVLREARRLGERTTSLQEKMMAFLRDSTRFFEALEYRGE
jgi:tetratricopeptide (TPR) repeat protein